MKIPVLIFTLVILLLVGGFSAVLYFGTLDRRSGTGNGQYDERQIRARGKAYKWGFYTMLVVSVAIFMVEASLGRELMAALDTAGSVLPLPSWP